MVKSPSGGGDRVIAIYSRIFNFRLHIWLFRSLRAGLRPSGAPVFPAAGPPPQPPRRRRRRRRRRRPPLSGGGGLHRRLRGWPAARRGSQQRLLGLVLLLGAPVRQVDGAGIRTRNQVRKKPKLDIRFSHLGHLCRFTHAGSRRHPAAAGQRM